MRKFVDESDADQLRKEKDCVSRTAFMEISRNCTPILSDARAVASASVIAPAFYGNFAKIQWRPTLRYPTLAPLRRIALLN